MMFWIGGFVLLVAIIGFVAIVYVVGGTAAIRDQRRRH